MFKIIYQLTNDSESVASAIQWTIEEFAADGCAYLELRSTPRSDPETGMTKDGYVAALLNGIHRASQTCPGITVKIILSMDRRHTFEESMKTVALAKKYASQGVVGLDICGDPMAGETRDLEALIVAAKERQIPITVHLAEMENRQEETETLLMAHPDRIGHGTFLTHGSKEELMTRTIPLEICMSSNVFCKTVADYSEHHFKDYMVDDHPCILCVSRTRFYPVHFVDG